jgi:cyanophycinase
MIGSWGVWLAMATFVAGPGPLVLHGGGEGSEHARALALELAGGREARVVIVPFAAADPDEAGAGLVESFREAGAGEVQVLGRDPASALRQLDRASLIWLTSGNQERLMGVLATMPGVVAAIQGRHREGAVVGGTSAGTAAVTGIMITGSPARVADPTPTARGLELWPGIVVDQHVLARERVGRLRDVVARHPGVIGVGIDEGAYLVVRGREVEVFGPPDGARAVIVRAGSPDELLRNGAHVDLAP